MKFSLIYNQKEYPPKFVISIANKFANGKELLSTEFSGGQETNSYLEALGFNIVSKRKGIPESSTPAYSRVPGLLLRKKQIILYGPPGTGKTFNAIEIAGDLLKSESGENS